MPYLTYQRAEMRLDTVKIMKSVKMGQLRVLTVILSFADGLVEFNVKLMEKQPMDDEYYKL